MQNSESIMLPFNESTQHIYDGLFLVLMPIAERIVNRKQMESLTPDNEPNMETEVAINAMA